MKLTKKVFKVKRFKNLKTNEKTGDEYKVSRKINKSRLFKFME